MKLVSVALLVCAVAMAHADDKPTEYDLNKAPELFEQFIKDYNRHYIDAADRQVHYEVFVGELKELNKLNKKHPTVNFEINNFADYTKEESSLLHGYLKP